MTAFRWIAGAVILAGAGGAYVYGVPQAAVAIGTAEPRTVVAIPPGEVAAPAVVEPCSEERAIATELKGRLAEVAVVEGDRVSPGQVVAQLDNADLKARLTAAEARVRLRESEWERLRNGARPEEKREAQAAVQEAEAALVLAKSELDRRNSLVDKGVVSLQLMDQARANLAGATARRNVMQERLLLLQAPPRQEDLDIAIAQYAVARAEADEIRAMLEKTYLRSPIEGTVLRIEKRAGEGVSDVPLTTVLRVGDLSCLRLRAEIDEVDIAKVAPGRRAYAMADAYGGLRFDGVVSRVGSRLGRKTIRTDVATERQDTRVLEALIELEPGSNLPVGLRVDVFIRADDVPH